MEKHNRFMAELHVLLEKYGIILMPQEPLEVAYMGEIDPDTNGITRKEVWDADGELDEAEPPEWDDIPTDDQIASFLHCRYCIAEWRAGAEEAEGKSPAEYSRLHVGWTPQGLQVWCGRHDVNIIHIDFNDTKMRANTEGEPKNSVQAKLEGEGGEVN